MFTVVHYHYVDMFDIRIIDTYLSFILKNVC